MSSSVTFRDATSADYDDVMNISENLYDGMDYLPARYHDYCKDPRRHMFVAEDGGKVVAFGMRLVTDGGFSNVSQAIRVCKEHKGRGLMTSLRNHAHREIMKRYPHMERTVYNTDDRVGVDSTIKKLPYQKLLAVRPRFSCAIMVQNLMDILKSAEFQSMTLGGIYQMCRRQSEDEALVSLLQEVPFTRFVHDGMWDIDWEPMGHHVDNYQKGILPKGPYPSCLRMADKALLAGYPRFQVLKNSSFYVSRLPDDDSIQAISFFTTVRVAAGWRCQTDFYCPRTEQNPKILVAHVLRHLEELMSLKEDVYIFLPTSYSTSYPGDVSKALLLKHLKGLEARGGSCELPDLLVSMNVADIEEYWKTNR